MIGVVLASAVVGALAGMAGFSSGRASRVAPSPWLAVGLLACLVVPIAVHELGHVVAGLAQGFTFRWMTVGPIRVASEHGRLRVRWNPLGLLWGGTAMLLPHDDRNLPHRMWWLAAGGPLASLGLAAVSWAAAQSTGGAVWLLLALVSLAIGVVTLVPNTMNGLRSDGARLLDLIRGGAASRRECRILAIAGAMSAGRRPAAWDAGLMHEILAEPPGYHYEVASLLSVYYWCLDRDAGDEAEAVLTRAHAAAEAHAPILRAAVHLECAWWHAVRRGDVARAEAELAAAGETPVLSESTRHRARAAVLWHRGAHDEARAEVNTSLAALAAEDMGGAAPLLERLAHESLDPR